MDTHSMFQQPWWLEATAPGQWDAVEVERGGETVAWLPYVVKKQRGLRVFTQPQLTQSLGPWTKETGAHYTQALSRDINLYTELIKKLPKFDVFRQNFAPEVTNWLPFYWNNFSQTTRYTYTVDLTRPMQELWSDLDKRDRRQLRNATDLVEAELVQDLAEVLSLNDMTFNRQGLKTPYDHEYVHQIDSAVREQARRWAVVAREKASGLPLAGIYMVAFRGRVYSLLSGVDPDHRHLNAGIVARWKAFEEAHSYGGVLDLQGSMMKTIERRNRNYGSKQVPYYSITKGNGLGKLALSLRALTRR